MTIKPEISIVIPHIGTLKPLAKCIESIKACIMIGDENTKEELSPSIPYEIIVVADKPDKHVLNYLGRQEYVKGYINDIPVGTEKALNLGLREALGNYLMYVMSDVVFKVAGVFDDMRDALVSRPEFGWVALSSEHTGFLAGCSMWTRDAFEKVGYWDEQFVSGGGFSDDDYLRRMWKAGYKPHILAGPTVSHAEVTSTTVLLGKEEKDTRFERNRKLFKEIYHEEGTGWDSIPKYTPPPQVHRLDWIKAHIRLDETVLECGVAENPCFTGTPYKVTTLDISRRPEENCLPDIVADVQNIPLADKSFDVVVLGDILEHVQNPAKALSEAIRVARKRVIITVPDEHHWPPALKPFRNPGHLRFFDKSQLRDLLEEFELPFAIESLKYRYWYHYGAVIAVDGSTIEAWVRLPSGMHALNLVLDVPLIETSKPEKVKLNLGSFVDTFGSGWWNCDILNVRQYIPAEHRFKQCDLRAGIPWNTESVDVIRCSHLIEHLTIDEAKSLLRECYRVLKPGGLLRIATPDARTIVRHFAQDDMAHFNAVEQPVEYIQSQLQCEKLSMLLYSLDYSHRAIYDFDMLKAYLVQAGFRPEMVFRSMAEFSHSEQIQKETADQHTEISLFCEAVR